MSFFHDRLVRQIVRSAVRAATGLASPHVFTNRFAFAGRSRPGGARRHAFSTPIERAEGPCLHRLLTRASFIKVRLGPCPIRPEPARLRAIELDQIRRAHSNPRQNDINIFEHCTQECRFYWRIFYESREPYHRPPICRAPPPEGNARET